jgi:hypothetical protein
VCFVDWDRQGIHISTLHISSVAALEAALRTVLKFEERVAVRPDPMTLEDDEATPPARPQGGSQPNLEYI